MQHVGGHHRIFGVGQDALQLALGRCLQRGVDLFGGGRLLQHRDQIDHGDVRGRNAHGVAVELALQFRHHQADRLGGAGGGGDHVERGGAGAAQILVREIEHVLVVGVAVDRGHRSLLDAEVVVQHLDHRGQAVGGAGRVGDDVVLGRIVHVVVHAEHDA